MLRFFRDYEYFRANAWPMVKTIIGLFTAMLFGMWGGLMACQFEHPDECMDFNFNLHCEPSAQANPAPDPRLE